MGALRQPHAVPAPPAEPVPPGLPGEVDALVDRAAAGDQQAFAALYRAHVQGVFALLTRLVGPRAEREDLLQDVFVRFHRALPGYRRDAALATFLHRITVRVALDHLRTCRRRPQVIAAAVDGTEPGALAERAADGEPSPAERVALRDEVARVLARLDRLEPAQRVAFVLREVVGLSYPEIAALQGCFATTARMRVAAAHRALARLDARERSARRPT